MISEHVKLNEPDCTNTKQNSTELNVLRVTVREDMITTAVQNAGAVKVLAKWKF